MAVIDSRDFVDDIREMRVIDVQQRTFGQKLIVTLDGVDELRVQLSTKAVVVPRLSDTHAYPHGIGQIVYSVEADQHYVWMGPGVGHHKINFSRY